MQNIKFENIIQFTEEEEKQVSEILFNRIPDIEYDFFKDSHNTKLLSMSISNSKNHFTKEDEDKLFDLFAGLAYKNTTIYLCNVLDDKTLMDGIQVKSEWLKFNFTLEKIIFDFDKALDKALEYVRQCILENIEERFTKAESASEITISKKDLSLCATKGYDNEYTFEAEAGGYLCLTEEEFESISIEELRDKLYNYYNDEE